VLTVSGGPPLAPARPRLPLPSLISLLRVEREQRRERAALALKKELRVKFFDISFRPTATRLWPTGAATRREQLTKTYRSPSPHSQEHEGTTSDDRKASCEHSIRREAQRV
jgi:hypothetical protein